MTYRLLEAYATHNSPALGAWLRNNMGAVQAAIRKGYARAARLSGKRA